MRLVTADTPITVDELREMSAKMFGNLVKAVVDIESGTMVVDADLHSDQETMLLERGSQQTHLWGINFYPELAAEDWLEFDSMINIRPVDGNRSRTVEDPEVQARIRKVVARLVR